MGAAQRVVMGVCCLLIGAAGTRVAMNSLGAGRERRTERLAAENRALKTELARRHEERVLLETEPTLPAAAPEAQGEEAPKATPAATEPLSDVSEQGSAERVMRAAPLAELLGLEPARQKYFEESYDRLLAKVLEAEKRHARISRLGEEVEIRISPFPVEGGALREEWTRFLKGALTSFEQERYTKLQLDRVLFPREIGLWDRTMVFKPQENTAGPRLDHEGNRLWPVYFERWTKPGEIEVDRATRWPWSGPDAYRCYRHLLEP